MIFRKILGAFRKENFMKNHDGAAFKSSQCLVLTEFYIPRRVQTLGYIDKKKISSFN